MGIDESEGENKIFESADTADTADEASTTPKSESDTQLEAPRSESLTTDDEVAGSAHDEIAVQESTTGLIVNKVDYQLPVGTKSVSIEEKSNEAESKIYAQSRTASSIVLAIKSRISNLTMVKVPSASQVSKSQSKKNSAHQYPRSNSTESIQSIKDFGLDISMSNTFERQADASTLARPLGYRELKLSVARQANPHHDKEIQLDARDLEETAALLRGIEVDPFNIVWPTNIDFSIEKGVKCIEEYVARCWKLCDRWLYHVEFIQSQALCYKNKYIFDVRWSIPTKRYPIPIACASVYFVLEVDIYEGMEESVKVHYVLEGSRYPHKPGEIPFEQKWIADIICEKMRMSRTVPFAC